MNAVGPDYSAAAFFRTFCPSPCYEWTHAARDRPDVRMTGVCPWDEPFLGAGSCDRSSRAAGEATRTGPRACPSQGRYPRRQPDLPVNGWDYATCGQIEQRAARVLVLRSRGAFALALASSATTSSPVPPYTSFGVR